MSRSFTRTIEVTPTPEECGRIFSGWNDGEQAEFFNAIARGVAETYDDGNSFAGQMTFVSDGDDLSNGGRDIMRIIGEYAPERGTR